MAPLLSSESELLLDIADAAVVDGLQGRRPRLAPVDDLPPALRTPAGVFATLLVEGELNGCIGSLGDDEPLGHGAARHAWSAAFADPRLPQLRPHDYDRLTIELSVLSPLVPIAAASRHDVMKTVRPRMDGLLLLADRRQAVFLPAVWEKLPDPDDFVDHLLDKAGLPVRGWPPAMQAWTFTVDSYERASVSTP